MRSVGLRRNILYCALQGSYWMLYCISITFASYFLLQNGYSNAEIGVILALSYVAGMVLQPLLAAVADKKPRIGTPGILLLGIIACIACLLTLLVLRGHSILLSAILVLFIGLSLGIQPLVNAFAFYLERLQTKISFGVARGCGSGSYAVFAIIIGRLTLIWGAPMLPYAGLASALLLLTVTLVLRREGRPADVISSAKKARLTPAALRRSYGSFFALLLGTFGIFYGHSLVSNFLMQIVENVGGNSSDLGTISSYTALLEIPAMLLFDRLERRISCTTMLKFAAVFFTAKAFLLAFASSVPMLYLVFLTQLFSFAVFIPASVRYVDRIMPPELSNTAQALITLMVTSSSTISSALGGFMIDGIGMRTTLLIGGAGTLLGTVAVFCGMRQPKRVKLRKTE